MTTSPEKQSTDLFVIEALTDQATTRWDDFVAEHSNGTLYHKSAWRNLINQVFGHDTHYLYAKSGTTKLVGILPLVRLKSFLFGDFMVSMPYFNYGGTVAISADVEDLLMGHACTLAKSLGVQHIEFRDMQRRSSRWPSRTDKVIMELSLPNSPEILWSKLGSKLRAQIKRPLKEGVEVVQGQKELLPQFYEVFCRNMRDLGTPVYPKEFFAAILDIFSDAASLIVIQHANKPIAAAFLLAYKHRLEVPWASSIREFNRMGVNMLLYWEVLKKAIEDRYRVFDFGRSSIDSGTYRFKKQWGAEHKQLYWHYWVPPARKIPQLTPDNPKYRLAVEVWKHLPLFLVNRLGPRIVKNLP